MRHASPTPPSSERAGTTVQTAQIPRILIAVAPDGLSLRLATTPDCDGIFAEVGAAEYLNYFEVRLAYRSALGSLPPGRGRRPAADKGLEDGAK
jgi:hypothetical protein